MSEIHLGKKDTSKACTMLLDHKYYMDKKVRHQLKSQV